MNILLTRPRPANLSPWDRRDEQVSANRRRAKGDDPSLSLSLSLVRFSFFFSFRVSSPANPTLSRNDLRSLDRARKRSVRSPFRINRFATHPDRAEISFAETRTSLEASEKRTMSVILSAVANGFFIFFFFSLRYFTIHFDTRDARVRRGKNDFRDRTRRVETLFVPFGKAKTSFLPERGASQNQAGASSLRNRDRFPSVEGHVTRETARLPPVKHSVIFLTAADYAARFPLDYLCSRAKEALPNVW